MKVIRCPSWQDVLKQLDATNKVLDPDGLEPVWFRGSREAKFDLTPTLMRETQGLSMSNHDLIEQDLFFEFQARAADLRERGLNEWEYLFYGRHYGVPTRLIDWTDTFGVAVYFALEEIDSAAEMIREPAIFIMNPYALNSDSSGEREITLPRYLGFIQNDFWDFGEMLAVKGKWPWDAPVAIYPIQLNERVRAQRGWFTIHGNDRRPLERQLSRHVTKLILEPGCYSGAAQFLELAGFNRYSMYPDLDHLAEWLTEKNRDSVRRLKAR